MRPENAEFLKTQLMLLVDGKSTTAGFLNALKGHYAELDKAAADAASANLTADERTKLAKAAQAGKAAGEQVQRVGAVKKKLAQYVSTALNGVVAPDEVIKIVKDAAKVANVPLAFGKLNPKTISPPNCPRSCSRSSATAALRSKSARSFA